MTTTDLTKSPHAGAMPAADWLRLITLSLLWGGTFFFAEIALAGIPPLTLAWLRVLLAALALLSFLAAAGRLGGIARWPWHDLLGMGLLNNALPFSLIFWGQSAIAGGLASILNATAPFWSVILAVWVLRQERLTAARASGLALGFAGVVVLIGPAALVGLGDGLWHQAAVLAAAFSYALAGFWGRRLTGLSAEQAACGQLLSSSLLLAPLALLVDRPWTLPLPAPTVLLAVLALALFSTALAYLLFFRILKSAGPTNLLLVTLLIPPSALLLGSLFLNESFGYAESGGLLLIFAGLAAIDGRCFGYLSRCFRH